MSHDPLFLFFGGLVRFLSRVFWSLCVLWMIDGWRLCLCASIFDILDGGLMHSHCAIVKGRSSMQAPLLTCMTTPEISSCTHFTSLVWLVFSSNSPQRQLVQSPNFQKAGHGWLLHFMRLSLTTGFFMCEHFLGEYARIGSPRTQRIMGCCDPPPHVFEHGVNPITFHENLRFLRPVEVVLACEFAALSL